MLRARGEREIESSVAGCAWLVLWWAGIASMLVGVITGTLGDPPGTWWIISATLLALIVVPLGRAWLFRQDPRDAAGALRDLGASRRLQIAWRSRWAQLLASTKLEGEAIVGTFYLAFGTLVVIMGLITLDSVLEALGLGFYGVAVVEAASYAGMGVVGAMLVIIHASFSVRAVWNSWVCAWLILLLPRFPVLQRRYVHRLRERVRVAAKQEAFSYFLLAKHVLYIHGDIIRVRAPLIHNYLLELSHEDTYRQKG